MDKTLDAYIGKIKEEIISSTCNIINIASVLDNNSKSAAAPFGENTVKALEYVLTLGKKMGFKTKNIDGKVTLIGINNKEYAIPVQKIIDSTFCDLDLT